MNSYDNRKLPHCCGTCSHGRRVQALSGPAWKVNRCVLTGRTTQLVIRRPSGCPLEKETVDTMDDDTQKVLVGRLYTDGSTVVLTTRRFPWFDGAKISFIPVGAKPSGEPFTAGVVTSAAALVEPENDFLALYPRLVERVHIVEE